ELSNVYLLGTAERELPWVLAHFDLHASACIMKDDTERMAAPAAQPAHTVTHIHPIAAACTLHRPVMHRNDCAFAWRERDDLGARLHARALFGEHEFPTFKIIARARQQKHDL